MDQASCEHLMACVNFRRFDGWKILPSLLEHVRSFVGSPRGLMWWEIYGCDSYTRGAGPASRIV